MLYKEDYKYLFKTVLIGNAGVGKTSISNNFAENYFLDREDPTIGVDFRCKVININDIKIKIQIWDTAGQEKFRSITRTYYRAASAIVIVFDLTDPESFEDIERWHQEAKTLNSDATIFLVGNKSDLPRKVNQTEINDYVQQNNLTYIECSAKTSNNINTLFEVIGKILYEKGLINNTLIDRTKRNLRFIDDNNKRKFQCCF